VWTWQCREGRADRKSHVVEGVAGEDLPAEERLQIGDAQRSSVEETSA
jgi:hypothetical protein